MSESAPDVVVRRLERADLSAALQIQAESYPAFLREHEGAFASRLEVAAPYCLAAARAEVLVGYLLAHGWPSRSPPAVGTRLARNVAGDVLFIHDLAVGSAGQGLKVGRRLIGRAFELAARDGRATAELIAVEGAASYWRTLGFADATVSPVLAAKLAGYGADARWMTRSTAPISGTHY
jgi:GNAT superfamily N-acetyltransferase